jgi:hypothetical protein
MNELIKLMLVVGFAALLIEAIRFLYERYQGKRDKE